MNTRLALALRAAGLGDLLTTVPALKGIRRSLPDHQLVLIISSNVASLASRWDFVDSTVVVDGLMDRLPFSLHDADIAFNLHGSGPQSHNFLSASQPRNLIAYANAATGHD